MLIKCYTAKHTTPCDESLFFQVLIAEEHQGQRGEGLCLPGHLCDDRR